MTVSPTGFVVGQSDHVLLWHWRLSHPSVQKFLSLVRVESFIFTLGCESYELGKHHHATYQHRVNNRNSIALELVHSDVWGPSHVPSVKGFRFFFIFIDDLCRMTWLYLLKERSEVSSVIELFFNEIKKNQFSVSFPVLCTNNALEYVKNDVFFLF